jgi:Gram-negative bacterial TonB protein C-terminal
MLRKIQYATRFLVLICAVSGSAQAQASANAELRDRAVDQIERGNLVEGAQTLQAVLKADKKDIIAWHWLGVSLDRQGRVGDARKAHERAGQLGDELLTKQLSSLTTDDDLFASLSRIRMEVAMASHSAYSYANSGAKISPSKFYEWTERVEVLNAFVELIQLSSGKTYKVKEVTTRPRIIAKPEPSYTELARQHQVKGIVVLRAIFADDGKVHFIVPLKRLPDGLTLEAMNAAKQIKFVPATKDGRPVSMWLQLEYNFNLF